MATLVLTAVGTAIGGPVGGAIGAFVGQQADGAIFGRGSREGPRVKELSVTTSSYGQPIQRHFGHMRVAGTVIWSTDLVETRSREGGGKGRPSGTSYAYTASFAIALSSVPIVRVGRIWADGNLLRGSQGDLKVGGTMRTYRGHGDDPVDPLIAADKGAAAPAFRDCAYVVFEDLQLADFGNRIPALTFEVIAREDPAVSLRDLVPGSVGLPEAANVPQARGFTDEGGALVSTLAAIDRVAPLTCIVAPGGLDIAARTSVPEEVPVLPEQLSDADHDDAARHHRRRDERPDREPLALRYYDEDRDYQPGVQRALGSRSSGRERVVDLPAAMTADNARSLATANAQRARWQHDRIVWRVGELDPAIRPGTVVRVPQTTGLYRVANWEWYDRGIELTLDRMAPDLGAEVAADAGAANTPADVAIGPTLLRAIEVPPDTPSDLVRPSIYAAASSNGDGWRGAALYVEQGGTLRDLGTAAARRAGIGEVVSPLEPSPGLLLEQSAHVDVRIAGSAYAFDSIDITGLALGRNRIMIDGEVLQFLSAIPGTDETWRLSGLLRGRAGTEDAAARGHGPGATLVVLDDALVPLDPALVPSDPATRIAAIGLGDEDPVYAALVNPGLSRRPPIPVAARRTVFADESWEWCWTRRARGHWRWDYADELPLVEEREAYTVGFGPVIAPHAVWTQAHSHFVLSTTDRADLVAQHGPGDLWVRQLGTFAASSALYLASLS